MDAQEPHSSDDISGSNLAVTPKYLQQQRKALGDFLNMSLEATHQANAFDNVEKIALTYIFLLIRYHENFFYTNKTLLYFFFFLVFVFNKNFH